VRPALSRVVLSGSELVPVETLASVEKRTVPGSGRRISGGLLAGWPLRPADSERPRYLRLASEPHTAEHPHSSGLETHAFLGIAARKDDSFVDFRATKRS
jgi:hypothetical protein